MGKEGRCKQITLACARSASATLALPPLTAHVASLSTLLGLYVVPPGTIRGRPWAACTSQVQAAQVQALGESSEAQTWLGLHFVPFPGLSSSGLDTDGSWQSNLEPEQCGQGGYKRREWGQAQCG